MSHIGFDPHALRSPRESVQGTLICAGDEEYKRAWSGWNGLINGHPALIVRCAGQLPQLLRCARLHTTAWLHPVAEVGLLGGISKSPEFASSAPFAISTRLTFSFSM